MLRILQRFILATLLTAFATQANAMFLQPDWFDPTKPGVGTNRYSYSHNDPVNKMDPTGNVADNVGVDGHENANCSACGAVEDDNDHLGPKGVGEHHNRAFVEGLSATGPLSNEEVAKQEKQLQRTGMITAEIGLAVSGVGTAVHVGRAVATRSAAALTSRELAKATTRQMLASANSAYKGGKLTKSGLTKAGRALSKHPNVVGEKSAQALTKTLGNNSNINKAAYNALNNILSKGARTTKNHKELGSITDVKLSSGIGARFSATDNSFIGFLGRGL